MQVILERLFIITLIITIFIGSLLVFGQLIGLAIQNGDLVIKSKDLFLKPAVIGASTFGMIAFIYGYVPKAEDN